jgi:hypothetical protein
MTARTAAFCSGYLRNAYLSAVKKSISANEAANDIAEKAAAGVAGSLLIFQS